MPQSNDIDDRISFPTVIHITLDPIELLSPPVIAEREEFGMENVTITLDWNPGMSTSYDVTVEPSIPVKFMESTSIQLVVSYNTMYNVSVVATLCEYTNTAISVRIQLSYGNY